MTGDPRTHGLWEASAPPAPVCVPLKGDVSADVIVVGAGFTGCSAALHLAQGGRHTVVLEANDIGHGGSGRNVGLVNAGMWVMPEALPAQLGEPFGERLLDQLGGTPRLVFDLVERFGIACEANPAGTLHCAVGRRGFAEIVERARQWQARGADVELLGREETQRRVGSAAYSGALLDRRAGTVQPLAYVRGLARAVLAQGATIHTGSSASTRDDLGDRWQVNTPGGGVTAPEVILATDAYSRGFAAPIGTEQVMLPYFNLATPPLPPKILDDLLPERQGVWDTRQILSSFRLDAAGRLVFGSVGALRGLGAAINPDWAGARRGRRRSP